jgi:DNA repair protein RadD
LDLRPYQADCILAVRDAFNKGIKNPLACLPTGSGKSLVITTLADSLQKKGHKVTVLSHTQEILKQLADTYEAVSGNHSAIYSASLGSKDIGPVTFAQIQSAANNAGLFCGSRVVLIDEADRVPVSGDGQYRTFLSTLRNVQPDVRVAGFTATPYRLGTGLCYGPGALFDTLVFDANVGRLIEQGFLCNLRTKQGVSPELSGVHVRAGEFVSEELELAMMDKRIIEESIKEIIKWGQDRHSWLLFCSGVKHAKAVLGVLNSYGIHSCAMVTGESSKEDRAGHVADFRAATLRCLVNINVLSVGFDAPNVDLIAMLRPTQSPGLYYQQIGRGLRKHPSKNDTLVLDLSDNIARHGPIDTLNNRIERKSRVAEVGIAPTKCCPQCSEIMHAAIAKCPACGYEFPKDLVKHGAFASRDAILSNITTVSVKRLRYGVHAPGDRSKKQSLKVDYFAEGDGLTPVASEFIHLDASGHPHAYSLALAWIKTNPKHEEVGLSVDGGKLLGKGVVLPTVLAALPFIKLLPTPKAIRIMPNSQNPKWCSVVGREWM